MEISKAPKVFISHAGEDQGRFVRDFATKLLANGVDAWYSEWEMLPGDKLIDKIFEQGIGEADAFIIVLSEKSVNKPWVREELDAALVARISKSTRVIPVVIDNCDVPVVLQATVYEPIKNVEEYDNELKRILAAIHGMSDKPSIGKSPFSVDERLVPIADLTVTDNVILKDIYDFAIDSDQEAMGVESLWKRIEPSGISRDDFEESLTILDERHYIDGHRGDGRILSFKLTLFGFHDYAQAYVSDLDDLYRRVAAMIVNDGETSAEQITSKISQPGLIVDYVLDLFENQGWLKVAKYFGGSKIGGVSPQLRRQLREWSG